MPSGPSATIFSILIALTAGPVAAQTINLPTSKQLIEPVPGHPQRLNSLPMSIATSPDGRYVVTVNAGLGTFESHYEQSLAVLDTRTGTLDDFPDPRTLIHARQTLYSGLAFSHDGSHLYASIGSIADPLANLAPVLGIADTGSGVLVYRFSDGKPQLERTIHLPLQQLAPGRTTKLPGGVESDKGVPFPAAIAVLNTPGTEKLLIADNLSDDVLLLDPTTGAIEHRFDLAEARAVPSTYPIALALSKDGHRAFVALWNASEIVELDLDRHTIGRRLALLKPSSPIAPGTHPCDFALAPDGKTLYVALANRDAVAAIDLAGNQFAVKGYFDTRLPGQSYFGSEPAALALDARDNRLFAANMGTDAVAVLDTRQLTPASARKGMVEPIGFIPTEWMPLSMTYLPSPTGGALYVATAKGKGSGPNKMDQLTATASDRLVWPPHRTTYIATLLYGSLATINTFDLAKHLPDWTAEVIESNRMKAAQQNVVLAGGQPNRIKHVIYIIKENRTYDQVLGDLQQGGKPIGNGDPSLTMYGASTTPNLHKLALQFGVLDNFYDSGEVSGDGHVWSTAAIGTDYLEKNWQQSYRGKQRNYDFEGVVAEGLPLLQNIPDVNEPASGYLWGNLAAHGKTYYHFGEYISTLFCDQVKSTNPQQGVVRAGPHCARSAVKPGENLPEEWGGGINKWPWSIPLIASSTATKPELVGHFAPESPDFNLSVPDQVRAEIFLRHLRGWMDDRTLGNDTMPSYVLLRLPDDHTYGTTPGRPTPKASVSDNDLAVGRVVDAVSHSPYWDDTAFFILEDDAQDGGDHVDAHRSLALVISRYSPHGPAGAPFVDSAFYSTVSVVRTIESLLGLPPMNNNDAFCSMISSLFSGPGDQPAYTADTTNRDNGLIYTANTANAPGAAASQKMDFRHADRAPAEKLNVILWKDAMGNTPVPAMLTDRHEKPRHDDDDDQ